MAAAARDLIFHTLILTAKAVLDQLRSAAHFASVALFLRVQNIFGA
jgi:hypothetical protein